MDNSTHSEDDGITMVDILKEEEELEENVAAVLGAGDDTMCSYTLGYMKRQPLYACLTCNPKSSERQAGLCLACSLHCHEDHELVELYTKRLFRCDCGNENFPKTHKCKLYEDKSSKNDLNHYNQNFQGEYCTCAKPYPDPDSTIDDAMIQCCICEDWYHSMHLDNDSVPELDGDIEMICQKCVPRLSSFLSYYTGHTVTKVKDSEDKINGTTMVDVVDKENSDIAVNNSTATSNSDECKLKVNKKIDLVPGALFFVDKWRESLCSCLNCKVIYKDLKVEYLLDLEDTVAHHEAKGNAKRKASAAQQELEALSSIDRITRTEMVHEYNNLSTNLRDYLKKFADNGKVVKDEDIREFFIEMTNKRSKNGPGFQFTCK